MESVKGLSRRSQWRMRHWSGVEWSQDKIFIRLGRGLDDLADLTRAINLDRQANFLPSASSSNFAGIQQTRALNSTTSRASRASKYCFLSPLRKLSSAMSSGCCTSQARSLFCLISVANSKLSIPPLFIAASI